MDKAQFLLNFKEAFDEAPQAAVTEETLFRDLEQWDSVTALNVIAMADADYGVAISGDEMAGCKTVLDIFNLIASKKK